MPPASSDRPPLFCACRAAIRGVAVAWALLVASGCGPAAWATADHPGASVGFGQYFCDSFGTDLGLPQGTVLAVRQTRDGALWVGCEGGLGRFDGVRFVAYRASNTPAFHNNLVHCLCEDRLGTLWIGTERGVVRYREGKFEHVGLSDVAVRAIVEDGAGRIWIGTGGRGLFTWRDERIVSAASEIALPSPWILSLSLDQSDALWVGFDNINGAARCENGTVELYDGGGALDSVVHCVVEQPRGTWWFGTHNRGLFRRDASGIRRLGGGDGISTMRVSQILPARDGGLWIAGNELQKLTGDDRAHVTTVSPAPTHSIQALCEDHEGNVWLAGRSDGLLRVRRMPYQWISAADGLPGDGVRTVAEDRDGNLWLSIQGGGVTRVASDGALSVINDPALPTALQRPVTVYPAPDGSIWCGTGTLAVWRNGAVRTFPEYRSIRGLFVDRSGTVWISSGSSGLMRYAGGRFIPVTFPNGRAISYVGSFAEAPDGRVYLGTWADGILCWNNGTVTVDDQRSGLPSNEVRALHLDAAGRLWAGFRSRGLALKLDGRWLNPSALSEAVADHVCAIEEDRHGRLWLGTTDGVMWAPKSEVMAAARGEIPVPHLHVVELPGGVRSTAVWPGAMPVAWKSRTGRLLFATRLGVLALDPDDLPVNEAPPPVRIEGVLADRRSLDIAEPISLSARTRNLAIEYTAFSFVQPRRVVFKYKLDGYDADWVDAGTRRTAYYTNLAPRRYVFRVLAGNSDGIWNETGAVLPIVVEPRWFQTWWFRVAAVLAFTAAVSGIARAIALRRVRERMRELEKQAALDRERARIARDLHDDVGARLTNIVLVSGLAKRDREHPDAVGARLDQVIQAARQLIQSVSQAVWAISPQNDTLRELLDYISCHAVEFLQTASIRCRVDLFDDVPERIVKSEVRHNLFFAVKEALHNIVRHSGATEVWLRVEIADPLVTLTIEDNGRGLPPPDDGSSRGNGLRNMRQRLSGIGGTVGIENRREGGLRITFRFPAPCVPIGGGAPPEPSSARPTLERD